MYNDSGQFGSFDGLDNRRDVMAIFARMGLGVPESIACVRRQMALERLLSLSNNEMARTLVQLTPCSTVEAYFAFTAITGVLGVPVELAAKQLEEEVRFHDRCNPVRGQRFRA